MSKNLPVIEDGWYKVKIYTKWMCAYFDGFCFVIFTEDLTLNVCAVGEYKPLHYQNSTNLINCNTDEYTTEPTIA